jgi:hypothetical protein
MRNFRLLLLAGVALFIAFKTLPARAADAQSPALIVASPGVTGPYAQSVIIALPAGNGTHGPQFALVRAPRAPTPKSLEVLPGLFMVFLEGELERLIERASSDAETLWARLRQ